MKKCKDCKSEIDKDAKKCPHCQADQRNWFARHPIWTFILVLFIIGLIGSAMGGDDKTTNTAAVDSNKRNEETKTEIKDAEKIATLNETVQDSDLAFTVTNVETASTLGNSFTEKKAQGTFYVITVKIENKGKKTATFDSSMAKIVDSDGNEYERSIDGQTAKGISEGNTDLFLQQIQPNLSVTGDVVFDLPATVKNPVLVLKGNIFNSGVKVSIAE